MKYLLDTNIFITSKNEMPADLWPTFWQRISELIQRGDIVSSIKVKEEIDKGADDLTQWMNTHVTPSFYYPLDSDILQKYSQTQNWANQSTTYLKSAKEEYARVADAYIVATASAKGFTVVTNEKSSPESRRRIKIPDACAALGVQCCTLNTVFRNLGVTI